MNEVFAKFLSLQGVKIAPEREEPIARAVAAMLEAERAATRGLQFEVEPSGFAGELERETHE
jgi:hypothetical protein